MATPKRNTRQRMINLMYLVFIAMLAINYPEEVLSSFDVINEKLTTSLKNTERINQEIYKDLTASYQAAPDKSGAAYAVSQKVKSQSDSLYNYVQQLKEDIVRYSDGDDANVDDIKNKDNLDASSVVMLSPQKGQGKNLRFAIDRFRTDMLKLINDSIQKEIVTTALSTTPMKSRGVDESNWEESSFESMPTIAAVTYLTELQLNIRSSEGAVLTNILREIDFKDLRVNKLSALVVPQSNIVMRGGRYNAEIIMAAIDSTSRPQIFVNNKELPASDFGKYSVTATSTGKHKLDGYIVVQGRDGSEIKQPFSEEYTVIEPMVTIAPTLMNVLYAKYNNPLSISVPGVPNQNLSISATGGSISARGNEWIAVPSTPGQKMTINVSYRMEGSPTQTLSKTFRVRQLPDPSAFISYKDAAGNSKLFKSGVISKDAVISAGGIIAAIDDGVLNVPFTVLSFRTMTIDAMGNASPEVSSGSRFSARQIDQIKRMTRGKTLIISSIKVKGPDGTTRDIYPMELRIN